MATTNDYRQSRLKSIMRGQQRAIEDLAAAKKAEAPLSVARYVSAINESELEIGYALETLVPDDMREAVAAELERRDKRRRDNTIQWLDDHGLDHRECAVCGYHPKVGQGVMVGPNFCCPGLHAEHAASWLRNAERRGNRRGGTSGSGTYTPKLG